MTDITPARLCELEAEVCACGSGVNIGVAHFVALMGREWCGGNEDNATDTCRKGDAACHGMD